MAKAGTWRELLTPNMALLMMMGFASGIPLALTGGTLQAWMTSEGVNLGTIGLFSMASLPYTLKFLWSPLMDRFAPLGLGRRRGWMLVTQTLLILGVIALGFSQPKENLWLVAVLAIAVAFFSASQDVVLDAWRRETLSDDALGFGSSVFVTAYLFAFRLVGGALGLILADHLPWSAVYLVMAGCIGVGLVATLLCREPKALPQPRSFVEAVVGPFVDFFQRPGAWLVLAFILLYKIGDNMALNMTTPFYLQLGFSKTEVGAISKIVGWISLAFGGILGGLVMKKIGVLRSLFWFGIFQAVAICGFALLNILGKDNFGLAGVICIENIAVGMSTTVYVAFMAILTNRRFTATQYALLSSLMGVSRGLVPAPGGYLAEALGWTPFFFFCALLALPGLILIPKLKQLGVDHSVEPS